MLKHASEIIPAAVKQMIDPPKPRSDAPVEKLQADFEFDLWDGPSGWSGKPVRPQLEAMLQAMWHFKMDILEKKEPRWLSLLGTSGAGKTYLAKKFWKWYRNSPLFRASMGQDDIIYPGSWCNWPRLAGELQGNEGYGTLEELQDEKICVIDEIGADRDKSGHVRDCLARMLSLRVGKFTVITSNMSLKAIRDQMDARIASRMLRDGSVVVDVEVPDFNLKSL